MQRMTLRLGKYPKQIFYESYYVLLVQKFCSTFELSGPDLKIKLKLTSHVSTELKSMVLSSKVSAKTHPLSDND